MSPTPNNHVQLIQVLNYGEYVFVGRRTFATKWQIIRDGEFFGNYPTKKDALAEVAKHGFQIISITKYNPNPFG